MTDDSQRPLRQPAQSTTGLAADGADLGGAPLPQGDTATADTPNPPPPDGSVGTLPHTEPEPALYRNFFLSHPLASFLLDTDGTVLACNPAAKARFGLFPPGLHLSDSFQCVRPALLAQFKAGLSWVAADGECHTLNGLCFQTAGGGLVSADLHLSPLPAPPGPGLVIAVIVEHGDSRQGDDMRHLLEDRQQLQDRIHEMDTIYQVAKLTRSSLAEPEFSQQLLAILQAAFAASDAAEVMLRLHNKTLQTAGFSPGLNCLSADIVTYDGFAGKITVACRQAHTDHDGAPFLPEGQSMLLEIANLVGNYLDRQKAEEKLKLASKVFECSKEGITITDAEGRVQSVNWSFSQITGYTFEDIYRQNLRILKSGRHDEAFYQEMWRQLNAKGNWSGEIWNRRKNGEVYPAWLSISQVCDQQGRVAHYIGLFMDITSLKEADERILFLAHHDPLTGLPNRTLLRDRAQQAFCQADREGTKVGLLYLDLDNFKYVNDSQGHPAGDSLLQRVADCIKSCVRISDTVSRLGGDEFAVVLTNLRTPFYLSDIAEKILNSVANAVVGENHQIRVSFSIGAAIYPDDGRDFDTLLKLADTALYEAKESGKNTYKCFTPSMAENMLERVRLDSELLLALRAGQFFLEYQPQFDILTGALVGMEALIRWRHPKMGVIPPARFIPIAERSSLIAEIGDWVLRESCRQNKAWHDAGCKLPIAVNLSPCQFAHHDMCRLVKDVLKSTGLPPSLLELEITESVLSKNSDINLRIVKSLREIGVRFSVDDFGAGSSSLSHLRRFAVDRIKIDQSFIHRVISNPEDATIVTGIIRMAQCLGLDTLAEGVETQEQSDFLRDRGCNQLQGFLFGPPLGHREMSRLLLGRGQPTLTGDIMPIG